MSLLDQLGNLSDDQLQNLINLANQGVGTRSPVWRPLKDMRPPTTAKGRLNRPHFEWSADPDPMGQVIPEYPKLFWDSNGVEVRIESLADQQMRVKPDWTSFPPNQEPLTPQQIAERELAMLSPEDQAFVLEQAKKTRLARIQGALSELNPDVLAGLAPQPVKAKKAS